MLYFYVALSVLVVVVVIVVVVIVVVGGCCCCRCSVDYGLGCAVCTVCVVCCPLWLLLLESLVLASVYGILGWLVVLGVHSRACRVWGSVLDCTVGG